jgi:hypothetical protein
LSQLPQAEETNFLEVTEIKAFPNPTSGKVNVWMDLNQKTEVELEVYDLFGRKLFSHTERTRAFYQEVDMQSFGAGVYLFKLKAGIQMKTLRVVRY